MVQRYNFNQLSLCPRRKINLCEIRGGIQIATICFSSSFAFRRGKQQPGAGLQMNHKDAGQGTRGISAHRITSIRR
ncbi:Uncharacterized protein DAT39_019809 [Clarias magur]|uniref:Uncharacterized protein n=1 Tax=Clarias magur TaxID=1594786 RepID=A0A8J4THA3_CLAMG|nr:Uncharacterized protein DAT39_019809 [Clarias magur]